MKTLHVLGDSISMHYGPYLERYLAGQYQYSRKGSIKLGTLNPPEDANGRDSGTVLEYLNICVEQGMKWDVLLLNCGLHDVGYDEAEQQYLVSIADYEANLGQIYAQAYTLTQNLIWVRTTPIYDDFIEPGQLKYRRINEDVEKYNAVGDKLAQQNKAWVIDLNSFCRAMGTNEIYEDRLHFTDSTRHLQGAFIAGHLLSLLPQFP